MTGASEAACWAEAAPSCEGPPSDRAQELRDRAVAAAQRAGQHAQPWRIAFLAMLEERLQADANAEERLAPRRRKHCFAQAARFQLAHAVGHRALAGKDDARGRHDRLRIGRDDDLASAGNPEQRLPH